MTTRPDSDLTVLQKLDLVPALVSILFATLYAAVIWHFTASPERAASFDRHIQNTITRQLTARLTVFQLQFIRGSTRAAFEQWKKANPTVETHSEAVDEGTCIHWLGDKSADKILFHLHGGGYILPLSSGHLTLLAKLRKSVSSKASGATVAVAFVEYSLAPHRTYPTQLREACSALTQLLIQGVSPSKIILSGDSAGAHIILSLISHLIHPHPNVPVAPTLSTPFGGLLLISPRVTNSTTAGSFAQNTHRDILSRETLAYWFSQSRINSPVTTEEGLVQDGFYTEPANAPTSWWNRLSGEIVSEVFVSAGEHECMRDDILRFAESWKDLPGMKLTLDVEEKGIHDSPLMDVGRASSDLTRSIEMWLKERI